MPGRALAKRDSIDAIQGPPQVLMHKGCQDCLRSNRSTWHIKNLIGPSSLDCAYFTKSTPKVEPRQAAKVSVLGEVAGSCFLLSS